jgi:hypothetical protein
MAALICSITGLAVVIGIGVAIWSFIDTRNKYYNEYKKRKRNDQ